MAPFPILYINLDKDVERRQRMQAQFNHLQLAAQRLPAVWWPDLAREEQNQYYSETLNQTQYFKALANGEKGCYCSHIKAWQALLDSSAPAMAIFEDDVKLLPDIIPALEALAQRTTGWDMIKLYSRDQEKICNKFPLFTTHSLITYQRIPSFAAGYVITRAGAQKLLASRLPFGRPVDVDFRFWFENDLRVAGVYPSVMALDDTSEVSSIWEQRDRLTLSQRRRKLLMKLRLTLGNALHR